MWLCHSSIPGQAGLGSLWLILLYDSESSTVAESCDVPFFKVPFHVYRNQGNIKSDPATQQQSHLILVLILQHAKLISPDKTHAGSFLGITSNSPQMGAAMLAAEEGYSLLAKYIFSYVMFREGRCVACQSYTCTCLLTKAAVHTGGLQ